MIEGVRLVDAGVTQSVASRCRSSDCEPSRLRDASVAGSACVANEGLGHEGAGAFQAGSSVCLIPCRILCLAYVDRKRMARRTVLTSRQRSALFALPQREADLLRHYTLSDEDLQYEHVRPVGTAGPRAPSPGRALRRAPSRDARHRTVE